MYFIINLIGISHLSTYQEYNKVLQDKIKLFHSIINKHVSKNKKVKIILLSDSVFLYVKDETYIESINDEKVKIIPMRYFFTVANIFRCLLENGILCRAGCSYGEYNILNTKLSKNNIFGKTVSDAVSLEQTGKGHRIFINEDIFKQFSNTYKLLVPDKAKKMQDIKNLVSKYINYQDYTDIFEFNWIYISNNIFFESNVFYKLCNEKFIKPKTDDNIVNRNLTVLNVLNDNSKLKHYKENPSSKNGVDDKNNEKGEKEIDIIKKYVEDNNNNISIIKNNSTDESVNLPIITQRV